MKKKTDRVLLFDRSKYIWLIAGLGLTAIGFLLMIGGGGAGTTEFSEDIFSFRRLTLAPFVVLAGYGMQIYAILKKTTNQADTPEQKKTAMAPRPTPAVKKHK